MYVSHTEASEAVVFKEKCLKPPSDKVLNILSALRADFIDSLGGKCFQLEHLILELSGHDKHCSQFEEAFRLVHNLKGAGGTHGFPLISSICHHMEDILTQSAPNTFDFDVINQLLKNLDVLHQFSKLNLTESPDAVDELTHVFQELKRQQTSQLASVMVVETSKAMSLLLQTFLHEMQLKTTLMHDGVQALQRLLHEPYDLLIVAAELPVLKGPALVSALQLNQGTNAAIPVVLISSQVQSLSAYLTGVYVYSRSPQLTQQLEPLLKKLVLDKSLREGRLI